MSSDRPRSEVAAPQTREPTVFSCKSSLDYCAAINLSCMNMLVYNQNLAEP